MPTITMGSEKYTEKYTQKYTEIYWKSRKRLKVEFRCLIMVTYYSSQ